MTSEQLLETETRLSLRLGRYGSQTGVGLPLLQCCVPLSVCFGSVLAWIGFAVARNKDACPSHPRILESDRTPAFLLLLPLLLLLLLLLLASAAGASAAACFCCGCLCCCCCCCTVCWSCSVFFSFSSHSLAKAIWWWML